MPILKNAKKALRVSERRATVNNRVRSRMRTLLQKMRNNPSTDQLTVVFSAIDKAVNKNLIHANKAARLKAQMSKLVVK